MGEDPEFFKEILLMVIEDIPDKITLLKKAIKSKNIKDIILQAHTVKSLASTIEACKIRDISEKIERESKSRASIEKIEKLSFSLKDSWDEFMEEIDKLDF